MKDKDTDLLSEAYEQLNEDDRAAARERAVELGYPEGSETYTHEEPPYDGIITVRTVNKHHSMVGGMQGDNGGSDDDVKDVQFKSEEEAGAYIAKVLPQLQKFEFIRIVGR